MRYRLLTWGLYSVLVALLPIGFNALRLATRGHSVTLGGLIGRGELLLIAVAVAAQALGDVIGARRQDLRGPRLVVGAALLLILALGAFYFADIAAGYATGEKLDLEIITRMSVVIFLGSLAVGASAVALSEVS